MGAGDIWRTIKLPATRGEAKALGFNRFFTGKPCVHGHLVVRLVSNGGCWKCQKDIGYAARLRDIPKRNQKRHEYYVATKARHAMLGRKWLDEHPEAERARWSRRRARLNNAPGHHSGSDIKALYKKQRGRCLCGVSIAGGYHVEHKTPLSRGGSNWPSNLQLLCQPCNNNKSTKTMDEWQPRWKRKRK